MKIKANNIDIEIEDIAHGLAFVARWNGQTRGDWPYSVAEHSLLVEEIFGRANPGIAAKWRLAAVLHDAARSSDNPARRFMAISAVFPAVLRDDAVVLAGLEKGWRATIDHASLEVGLA